MRGFLRYRSRRWGYDGWAVKIRGAAMPLAHTTCTTREEARAELAQQLQYGYPMEIVKVRIGVEEVR